MTHSVSRPAPRRFWVLAALALAGVGFSVSLTQHFYEMRNGSAAFRSFCNIGSTINCDVVAASRYAEVFGGLPLASFATGWFLALFAIVLKARNPFWRRECVRAALGIAVSGMLFSLGYLLIMVNILKTLCLFCLVIDGINLIILGLVLSLKPEGFSHHKPDRAKWKLLLGTVGASLVIAVLGLRTLDAGALPTSTVDDYANAALGNPILPVNAGPEFPSFGPAQAPITIVEFSDFQCPFCHNGALILHSVMERFPNQVRVVFRHWPLDHTCNRKVERPMHAYACEAARAAACAQKQSKFQAVYETYFENQAGLGLGRAIQLAEQAGVNGSELITCMNSPETANIVSRDLEEGIQLGVGTTPTFFINGHKMEGAMPPSVWFKIINTLLKQPSLH
ncbi:thioredoxin domain-containing protein [Bdellovibrionota bacterium FG-1]